MAGAVPLFVRTQCGAFVCLFVGLFVCLLVGVCVSVCVKAARCGVGR